MTGRENRASRSRFLRCVLGWYGEHGRSLPWRDDLGAGLGDRGDVALRAYRAWVAETMLQQTTVVTVVSRYRPFLERFPSVDALAEAPREDVLHAWQGLGYYARARRLHESARRVVVEGFPVSYEGWRALSGVGDYTASALSVLVGGDRRVVTDTNIRRLYARLFAENDAGRILSLAADLLPARNCGDYTQALMDLGAEVCRSRHPRCEFCPVRRFCAAHRRGMTGNFPVVRARVERPVRRATAMVVVRRVRGRRYLLFRRNEGEGLLGGLWELPSSDFRDKALCEDWGKGMRGSDWRTLFARLPVGTTKRRLVEGVYVEHGFTHVRLIVRVVEGEAVGGRDVGQPYCWCAEGEFGTLALSTLMRKVLAAYTEARIGTDSRFNPR